MEAKDPQGLHRTRFLGAALTPRSPSSHRFSQHTGKLKTALLSCSCALAWPAWGVGQSFLLSSSWVTAARPLGGWEQ